LNSAALITVRTGDVEYLLSIGFEKLSPDQFHKYGDGGRLFLFTFIRPDRFNWDGQWELAVYSARDRHRVVHTQGDTPQQLWTTYIFS
jgi:hypothetical protein